MVDKLHCFLVSELTVGDVNSENCGKMSWLTSSECTKMRHHHKLVFKFVWRCNCVMSFADRVHVVDSLPYVWMLDGRIITCE